MPRLAGVRERSDLVIPLHIPHLTHAEPFFYSVVNDDTTLVILDVCAETPHVTVSVHPLTRTWPHGADRAGVDAFVERCRVTGPWLVDGNREPHFLSEMLTIATDAANDGRARDVVSIMKEVVERSRGINSTALMRPVVISVRAPWRVKVELNPGVAPMTDAHVWLRCLKTRDVA